MANKKKGKVVQMLSPKKYIRQKARSLPIFECYVNTDWQEAGIANIIVSRKHSNSNITMGLYLVDLKCLGVKEAFYHFNISNIEYREFIDKLSKNADTATIPYALAHNIIFAGLEYAEEFGFKPHPEFNSVAQYIIEEDTDDIELIDIECGMDGLPCYVKGPYDSEVQSKSIIAQLEKAAGPGNYNFIDTMDEDFDDEDFDDEEFDDFDEDYFDDEYYDDYYDPSLSFNESLIEGSKTFQFKVVLNGLCDHPVWRRITVPSYYTFMHMHYVLQLAVGWGNNHLFQFSDKGFESETAITKIFEHLDAGDQKQVEAEETPLSQIFKKTGDTSVYIYDFGDAWEHTLTLEKILPKKSHMPEVLDVKGACPPEDCGGVYGYENMLEVIADKSNPESLEYKEWLGMDEDEEWDSNEFDLQGTNNMLTGLFEKLWNKHT
ncbi:MAG: plasmid pRiA4b ORF-3 family protein [Prolixibacteraceae bacterium]|jgi:hypothetical protein|nr:plasmid pRiA4b ORF-3 family protein [Prolixibacteraceae bacterium]